MMTGEGLGAARPTTIADRAASLRMSTGAGQVRLTVSTVPRTPCAPFLFYQYRVGGFSPPIPVA